VRPATSMATMAGLAPLNLPSTRRPSFSSTTSATAAVVTATTMTSAPAIGERIDGIQYTLPYPGGSAHHVNRLSPARTAAHGAPRDGPPPHRRDLSPDSPVWCGEVQRDGAVGLQLLAPGWRRSRLLHRARRPRQLSHRRLYPCHPTARRTSHRARANAHAHDWDRLREDGGGPRDPALARGARRR